jgi:subtilisin family serine protease
MQHTLFFKISLFFIGSIFVFEPFLVLHAQTPNDPFFNEQWHLQTIRATQTWTQITNTDPVIVAVLDAGFDLNHPDLTDTYWENEKEIAGNRKDDDNNGFEDDKNGWDFVDSDPFPTPSIGKPFDDTIVSHGTVIAGLIGATENNGEGIAGIHPRVQVMPLRILDEHGAGSTFDVRQAIVYAVNNGAQIINLSLTADQPDEKLHQTIVWAVDQGVVIVAAVGNGGRDIDQIPSYPACYDVMSNRELVIGVAATDKEDKKATFSNFGSKCTDLAAPGTNIFSTVYHDPSDPFTSTAYGSPWEGTSIAAPMVSAAVAILKSVYPSLTPQQVALSLKLSVDPVGEKSISARKQLGAGRLNVERALENAKVFSGDRVAVINKKVAHSGTLVVAQGRGSEPRVVRVDAHGEERASFLAYHKNFRGGVSVAVGDVTGDGVEEIITGARRGGGPQVRVFDLNGKILSQFFADNPSDRGGIFVGSADTDWDGTAEIIVTPETGGTGEVKLFNRFGQLQGLIRPFGRQQSPIGLGFGNMDEDPEDELITLLSDNQRPVVRVLDGNGRYVREFPIPDSLSSASVTSGDVDGDGLDEVILSSSSKRMPFVEMYSSMGERERFFIPYAAAFSGGVNACAGDIDQNGRAEIYTVPKEKGGPHVRIFEANGQVIGGFFPFESKNRFGAVCAIWNP